MKEATFGAMVIASLGGAPVDGVAGDSRQGGRFSLPLDKAAITATNIGGREVVVDGVTWLRGDSAASPIMARIGLTPTSETHGKIASGQALPATSMQGERLTATFGRGVAFPTVPAPVLGDLFRFLAAATGLTAVDEAGAALTTAAVDDTFRYNGTAWQRTAGLFGEHDFDLDSTIESKSEISLQLAMQSEFALDELLEAQRLAISDRLLLQVLAGDGTGNNLAGVAGVTGIGGATYATADRGKASAFQDAEDAVEDAGGRMTYEAWALGTTLSASTRRALLEPGSDRRTEERERLSLSGIPVQRIGSELTATTGLLADWGLIVVPILDRLDVVTDRITNPGDVRITSRLACANPIVTHPATVYALSQA